MLAPFYGPFRDALDSAPKWRQKTLSEESSKYQGALIEADLDIEEGADFWW